MPHTPAGTQGDREESEAGSSEEEPTGCSRISALDMSTCDHQMIKVSLTISSEDQEVVCIFKCIT